MDFLIQSGFDVSSETLACFQEKHKKENRNEIRQLLDQKPPDEPVTKRIKFE